jgi:hypothetical protein
VEALIPEAQTVTGELVNARRRRAAQLSSAVGAQVAVPNVIGEKENDVGLLRLLRGYQRARKSQGDQRSQ